MDLYNAIAPTKRYFITMFMVSCTLLTIFTAVIYRQSQMTDRRNEWVIHSYNVLGHARNVLAQSLNFEAGQRGYLLSGSSKFFDPYNSAANEMEKEVALLAVTIDDNPTQKENVATLRADMDIYREVISRHLKKFLRNGKRSLSVADLEESQRAMDAVRLGIDQVMATEYQLLDQRLVAAHKQQRRYLITLFVGTALGLGALAIANVIIYSLLTRSRRIEDELDASEKRFTLVMNGLNDGIFDYNLLEGSIYYSSSYKNMLGYGDDELPNTLETFNTLIHPDDKEQAWATLHQYSTRKIADYTNIFRLRHKDNTWRWHMARGVGIWDEDGVLLRLIGSHTDITPQKEREEELKQLNADLEGFTYIASHDLRAPLVNLKGFAGEITHALNESSRIIDRVAATLSEEERTQLMTSFNKDIPESLGFINSAVERMDKLTSAILHMSRIGRREYRIEATNTQAVVQRCLDSLAHDISQRGVTIECAELPSVHTDPLALEQVFGNLLDNAIKYLDPTKPGQIWISSKTFLTEILFSVSDNGRGISDHDAHKVFEIFRRAGNSNNVRGTGMGMAYVKTLLRKIGGRIWFESVLGEGTTFYFTLPLRATKETTKEVA